ncbi:MAG TPA: hypothetical protein VGK93_02225 [Candidatus Eisenbacteria bacterium]|jgi:hypothetical protein
MRRGIAFGLLISLVAVTPAHAATRPASATRGPRLSTVTFGIRHRVFHDFSDRQMVKLNQDFILGDTEFSARVVQYVPDFQMDLRRHKIFSLTDQPNNPAFKIVVRKNKVPHDTTWAFLKSPPHFGARSYFAFQVLRVDFVDRPPLAADTLATDAPAAAPGAGTAGATGGSPAKHATGDSLRKP